MTSLSVESAPLAITVRARDLCQSGRSREARELLTGALPSIERRGDRAALRQALNLLGAASFETGQLPDAEAAFDRALELGRADGDDAIVAKATNNLGAIANVRGERDRALAMYSLAVAAYQRLGQAFGLAAAYHNMAITFRHIGLLERADDYERRAIEFAIEADDPHLLSLARIGRAELSMMRGDARLAEATALLVAREFASRSEPTQQANALRVAGAARTALGDLDGARAVLDQGLALARAHGAALVEAELLRARADLHCWRHERLAAREDATAAIGIFDRLAAREDSEKLGRWLAAIEAQVNDGG